MLTYPHIDPVAIHLEIRWYALAYLAGVLGGWWLVGRLNRRLSPPPLSREAFDDIMVWAIGGIILGGRLGYVLFYKPAFYFDHPLEIVKIWQGGMSFHGGLVGVIIAMLCFARKYAVDFLAVTDLLAPAAPLGLFFGRMANFINGELYGRVTDSPLGMVFPNGGPLPRHPSQLYEAGLEGIALFTLLAALALGTRARDRRGLLTGLFLIGYACARGIGETFREPDDFITFLPPYLTMGQLLCIPMLVLGLCLVFRARAARL